MGIVFPSEAVARRWEGALPARLRRAPLENFLHRRGIVPAPAGVSQDSDNIVRATVLMVEAALALQLEDPKRAIAQPALIGHVACVVSQALAQLIAQPGTWRTAALVSTAQMLSPYIGLKAAALASASSVRRFHREQPEPTPYIDARVSQAVFTAIAAGAAAAMAEASASIAARLNNPLVAATFTGSQRSRHGKPAPA